MISQSVLDELANMHPVYYRIYLNRDNLLCVVCMQDFDEYGYHEERFLKDDSGDRMRWEDKSAALKYLNDNFKREHIHADDLTPNHPDFRKYRIDHE